MVKKYVKKPVVVEAIQFNSNAYEVKDFLKGTGIKLNIDPTRFPSYAQLQHDDQILELSPGDFIVRGVDGSIYPVHEETFWKVYDEYKEEEKMDVVSW